MNKKNKKDKKYSHIETDKVRATIINFDPNNPPKMSKNKGIPIKIEYPESGGEQIEFTALGFSTVKDKAGDEVFHFKIREKDRLALYILTPHPDSTKLAEAFKLFSLMNGYQAKDMRDYAKECVRVIKGQEDGTIKAKDGVHPKMKEHIENEYEDKDNKE